MGNADRHVIASKRYKVLVVVRDQGPWGRSQDPPQDEGHRIKRADCKLALQLKHVAAQHRLLLTGARPDDITALYVRCSRKQAHRCTTTCKSCGASCTFSCLACLAPQTSLTTGAQCRCLRRRPQCHRFGGLVRRLGHDAAPLNEEEQLLITNRLHQVLCPFMLRRLKQDVLGNLPRKVLCSAIPFHIPHTTAGGVRAALPHVCLPAAPLRARAARPPGAA